MELRDVCDQMHYPGSSNEFQNGAHENYDSDDKRNELANVFKNRDDPFDINNFATFQDNDIGGFADYEIDQNDIALKHVNLSAFETTQGTFYGRYLNSYHEINSLIEDDSKKRRNLMNSINSGCNSDKLTFNQLMKKFKASSITSKDKVEVFLNLLHLKRENKITLEQNNNLQFSDIYIATKI